MSESVNYNDTVSAYYDPVYQIVQYANSKSLD